MGNARNTAPRKLELLFTIVQADKSAYFTSIIQANEANLHFFAPCKGTATQILDTIGLTSPGKTLIMSIVREDKADGLIETLKQVFSKGKDYKGIAFTVPFTSMIGTTAYGFLSNEKQIIAG